MSDRGKQPPLRGAAANRQIAERGREADGAGEEKVESPVREEVANPAEDIPVQNADKLARKENALKMAALVDVAYREYITGCDETGQNYDYSVRAMAIKHQVSASTLDG
jgi:hypothetical protein